jgi:hypothetical protein
MVDLFCCVFNPLKHDKANFCTFWLQYYFHKLLLLEGSEKWSDTRALIMTVLNARMTKFLLCVMHTIDNKYWWISSLKYEQNHNFEFHFHISFLWSEGLMLVKTKASPVSQGLSYVFASRCFWLYHFKTDILQFKN